MGFRSMGSGCRVWGLPSFFGIGVVWMSGLGCTVGTVFLGGGGVGCLWLREGWEFRVQGSWDVLVLDGALG